MQQKARKLIFIFLLLIGNTNQTYGMMQYAQESLEIFTNFIKKPKSTGALTASSPWLTQEIIRKILEEQESNPNKELEILELGFGPGPVTRQIIPILRSTDHLDAIEYLEEFYKLLDKQYPKEEYPNVTLVNADFTQWNPSIPQKKYDIIVCTIPFVSVESELLQKILEKISILLKKDGWFTYISFVGAKTLGYLKFKSDDRNTYSAKMTKLDKWINEEFYNPIEELILGNIPPAKVYHLQKK